MRRITVMFTSVFMVFLLFIAVGCTRNEYTIKFELNGGTPAIEDIVLPVNEIPEMPENPTKEGYSFGGWYLDKDFNYKYTPAKIENSFTLYAKWNVNSYVLSFETNGAAAIQSVSVEFGGTITLPESPEKNGHQFLGWYTDALLSVPFETTMTMPAKDMTLYAKWGANKYLITFLDENSVAYTDLNQEVDFGKTVTKPADPVREGFSFKGWYIGTEAYDFNTVVSSALTIESKWEINQYTISFDSNGGSEVADATYDYYELIDKPQNPTKVGYVFMGWKLNGEAFNFDDYHMPAENLELVASWEAGDYAVVYVKNNENAEGTVENFAATYDETFKVSANAYTLTGYTFVGWNTKADGTGTTYAVNSDAINLASEGSVSLYAMWEANQYTVSFDNNGGTGSMANQQFTYDSAANLTANSFEKTGYTFAGWNTKADGTGINYTNNASVLNLATEGNVTLYAKWDANKYTVSFDNNGGTGLMANQTLTYDLAADLSTNTFERIGYSFLGWATTNDATTATYLNNAEVENLATEGNVTLYAVWQINTYNVTFVLNNGEQDVVVPYTYGAAIAAPATNPEKQGYEFDSWIDDEGIVVDFTTATMPAENITITAKYLGEITVTYVTNGGSSVQASLGLEGQVFTAPTDPTRTGYEFAGWYSDQELENEYEFTVFPTTNIQLYAKWTANVYEVTFNNNGGTGTMANQQLTYDANAGLTTNTFEKTGYTFAGWNTKSDGKGTTYTDGSTLNISDEENVVLYAMWTANKFTVTFNGNGGTGSMDVQNFTYDANANLTSNAFTKDGYTFAGWATSGSAEASYENGESVSNLTAEDNGNVVLYAVWTPNNFTVSFNNNGGTGSMDVQNFTYDVNANLTANTFERTGYRFQGWATANDAITPTYLDGANVSNLTKENNKTITLYAVWKINTYTVNFYTDDSGVPTKVEFFDHNDVLELPTYNKIGYAFKGWFNSENQQYDESHRVTSNLDLFAKYEVNQYLVQFIVEGKVIYSVTKNYGEEVSFDEYLTILNNKVTVISGFHQLLLGVASDSNTYLPVLMQAIAGDTSTINMANVYAADSRIEPQVNVLVSAVNTGNADTISGAVQALYGLVDSIKSGLELEKMTYDKNNGNPSKENAVFGNWVLGNDTVSGSLKTGDVFDGKVPASTVNGPANIVASWKSLSPITPTFDKSNNELKWDSVSTEGYTGIGSSIELEYRLYNLDGEVLTLLDTTNTNNYVFSVDAANTDAVYFAPGVYNVYVIAVISIKDANGNVIAQVASTQPSSTLEVTIALRESNLEIDQEGDYYYKGNENGVATFYFYTNMTYEFATSNTFILTDENGIEVDSSVYARYVDVNNNVITTTDTPGSFYFYSTKNPENKYYARVLPYVSQFDLGPQLQTFNMQNNTPASSLFLDKTANVYQVGVAQSNSHTVLPNNGFRFDLSIKTTGGADINYLEYADYLEYKFYDITDGGEYLVEDNSTIGKYTSTTASWEFNSSLVGKKYKVVISIKGTYVPKAIKGTVIKEKEFVIELNNKINVYTHAELKAVFADTTLKNGINIHAEIKAQADANQFYGYNTSNPLDSNANNRTLAEGTVINTEVNDIMANLGNSNMVSGNIYLRASRSDLKEEYVINGNLFNIDGTNLPYTSIYSFGNTSSVNGYEISNTQIALFAYHVTDYVDGFNSSSTSSVIFNDISITGNTKNYSALTTDGTQSSIDLMNKNSGGYYGIMNFFGSTTYLNNVIIRNTNIGAGHSYTSSCVADYVLTHSNWGNSFYGYGLSGFKITNSLLKDSGGAAMHFEDVRSTTTNKADVEIYFDNTTKFENYLSGEEGYFKAYSMELAVMQLKTKFENAAQTLSSAYGVSGGSYSIINNIVDPVTSQATEKINLILLMPPAGNNKNGSTTSLGTGAITNYFKLNIGNSNGLQTMGTSPYIIPNMTSAINTSFDYDVIQTLQGGLLLGNNYDAANGRFTDGYLIVGENLPIYNKSIIVCQTVFVEN